MQISSNVKIKGPHIPPKKSARGIFLTNSFRDYVGDEEYHFVYYWISYLNHSCDPNVGFDNKMERLLARRDIAEGEELLCSYVYIPKFSDATYGRRREFLFAQWGFWCKCRLCLGPAGSEERSECGSASAAEDGEEPDGGKAKGTTEPLSSRVITR